MAKTPRATTLKAVRLPDEYIRGLERIAARNYESVSDVFRRAIRELILREEKNTK
jgi:Arc/MetJ-type ribon-helix-helix transcriptional regulator